MNDKKIKTKRWIAIVSVLVLIAIAVVLIVVLWPKDPKRIISETEQQSQTMFLRPEGQEELYTKFQEKTTSTELLKKKYSKDNENVYSLAKSLNKIIDFYAYPLTYVESGASLQNRYGDVIHAYEDADKEQSKMVAKIKDVMALSDADVDFIDGGWKDFKAYFVNYFGCYSRAVDGLSQIYQDCIPRGVTVNDFSVLVSNTVNLYLKSIHESLKEEGDYQTLATKIAPKVKYLETFLNYFDKTEKYVFSPTMQAQVEQLCNFEQNFNTNMKVVIDSATSTGFSYTTQDSENAELLQLAKTFLKGELA